MATSGHARYEKRTDSYPMAACGLSPQRGGEYSISLYGRMAAKAAASGIAANSAVRDAAIAADCCCVEY